MIHSQTTLPFFEGFESGSIPAGWNNYGNSSWTVGSGDDYYYSGGAHTGLYNAKISQYSMGLVTKLLTPVLDLSNYSSVTLSFWFMNHENCGDVDELRVYCRNDVSSNNWVLLDAFATAHPSWTQVEMTLSALSSTFQLAFEMTDRWGYGVALDDVMISPAPSCTPVTDLSVDSISVDWAVLSWTDTGSANSWVVEYANSNFTPGTGVGTVVNTSSTHTTLTGLSHGTPYHVYVHANCGSDTSLNQYLSFTTQDSLSASLPYFTGFEPNQDRSWITVSGSQPNAWYVGTAAHASGNNSLYVSGNGGISNSYVGNGSKVYAYRDLFFPETGEYSFSYNWRGEGEYNQSYDYMRLFLAPAGTQLTAGSFPLGYYSCSSFASCMLPQGWYDLSNHETAPFTLTRTDSWQHVSFTKQIEAGTYRLVVGWFDDGGGGTLPGAIDDVSISQIGCPQVQNLHATHVTTDSITLSWTSGGVEDEWILAGNNDTVVVHDTTYTVGGLLSNTAYHFVVLANCGSDTSIASQINVRTACGPFAPIPYSEDFNTYSVGSVPACWTIPATSSVSVVSENENSLYFTGGSSMAITPRIPIPVNRMVLSFDLTALGNSSTGVMCLGYTSDPNSPDSIHYFYTIASPSTYSIAHCEFDLSNDSTLTHVTDSAYVVFRQNGSSSLFCWLDNLQIEQGQSCVRPDNLRAVSTVKADSVVVGWDALGTATVWELVVASHDGQIDESQAFTVYENGHVFRNLSNGIGYDIYVRSDCGDGYSSWRGPLYVIPGSVNMPMNGVVSATGCDITVYDDGGPTGNYGSNGSGMLVIYPSSADSLVSLWGTFNTQQHSDRLSVFDGVGINGTVLVDGVSGNGIVDTVVSSTGPLTVYFVSDILNATDGFELHTKCVSAPVCGRVEQVAVATGPYSALVSWIPTREHLYGGATIQYMPSSYSDWSRALSVATNTTNVSLVGLSPMTAYRMRIAPNCGLLSTDWQEFEFATTDSPCIAVDSTRPFQATIGNGGTNSYFVPVNGFYGNSFSEQLYLGSEFDSAGTISGINFNYTGNIAMTAKTNCFIYFANTDQASVSSSNYIPVEDMTLVYSGPLNCVRGWNHFDLDSSYPYSGGNLMVAVVDNSNAFNSTSYTFSCHSVAGRCMSWYSDNQQYPSTSMTPVNHDFRPDIRFNMMPCAARETCLAPLVYASSSSVNAIDLTWVPGGSDTCWAVSCCRHGMGGFTVVDTVTTTSYTVSGLLPGSQYDFRVRSMCGSDSVGIAEVSCYTACGLSPVPMFEDFEGGNVGEVFHRPCWYAGTASLGSLSPYPVLATLPGQSNHSLKLYNGAYLVLPEYDAPLNTLQVRFNLTQGTAGVRLMLGLLDDLDSPIASITPIDTLVRSQYDSVNTTVALTYPLYLLPDNAHGNIVLYDAWNDDCSYIDDLYVEPLSICSQVSNVTVSNVTATTALVSWNDLYNNFVNYLVEYGPRGFTPGQGTRIPAYTRNILLTSIASSTAYDLYVYAICDLDTSLASNRVSFATLCGPVTLPYYQDFEYVAEPGIIRSPLPNCWNFSMIGLSFFTDSTFYPSTYFTSPIHTASGHYCLFLYGMALTVLPEMPVAVNRLRIDFHEYNQSPGYFRLVVGAVDSVTSGFESSFVAIDTMDYNDSSTYYRSLFLDNYSGTGRYIAFKNMYTPGYDYTFIYIDDIVVDSMPSCFCRLHFSLPTRTTTTASITWNSCAASGYEYEVGPTGFVLGSGVRGICGDTAFLAGLVPSTAYDIYVRPICAITDTGDWSMLTFNTLRSEPYQAFPYLCTFADTAESNAWEFVNSGQNNQWMVGSGVWYGSADSRSLYISDNGNSYNYNCTGTSISYAYRTFDFDVGDYEINYNWKAYGESNFDFLRVWLVPAPATFTPGVLPNGSTTTAAYTTANPAGWIPIDGGSKLNGVSAWQSHSQDFTISQAGLYHLVFMWANDNATGQNPPAAIDNVAIYQNNCPAPVDIFSLSTTTTSVNVDWTDRSSATHWQVEYGLAGHALGSGTTFDVAGHPVSLSGLSPFTAYDFYVRPICLGTDTGRWSVPATFQTLFCDGSTTASTGVASGTGCYAPVSPVFGYGLVEVILDSSELVGLVDMRALMLDYAATSPLTVKDAVDIYIQPTHKSVFSNAADMVPLDTTTAVKVYSGRLDCQQGQNAFLFDTTYHYGGNGNLLLIFDDNSGAAATNNHLFSTSPCSGYKTLAFYGTDINPIALSPASFSGPRAYLNCRPVMQLISCDASACPAPIASISSAAHQQAVLNWSGSASVHQVAVKPAFDTTWPAETTVSGNSHTFANLQPATEYMARVRQVCDDDSIAYSAWTIVSFTTDSVPCTSPSDITPTDIQGTRVTLGWTAGGSESVWDVHIFNPSFDSLYTYVTNPATLGGLSADVAYFAAVRARCGGLQDIEGDWSDTAQFTTITCPNVVGLVADDVTSNSVTLSWATVGVAESYIVEYGYHDFSQGTGTVVTGIADNHHTVTDLDSGVVYDFYVKAVCGNEWVSEGWSSVLAAKTGDEGIADVCGDVACSILPNPTSGHTTISVSGVDGPVRIQLIDMGGKLMASETLECSPGCIKTMDVRNLAKGTYFVRISGDRFSMVKKLVVR